MHVVKITDKLSVAKQPTVEEFGEIAGAGFSALIKTALTARTSFSRAEIGRAHV